MTEKVKLTFEERTKGNTLVVEDFTDYNGENGERWVRLIDQDGRLFNGYVKEEVSGSDDE